MQALFQTFLRMSLTGSVVILAVLLARLALMKAPKKFAYALWAVVLFRLLCPVSFSVELPFQARMEAPQLAEYLQTAPAEQKSPAVQPSAPQTHAEAAAAVKNEANTTVQTADQQNASFDAQPQVSRKAALPWTYICTYVWILGVAAMLVCSAVSLARLKKRLKTAAPLRENLYLADVDTPFVLGLVRPRIYLPAGLGEQEMEYIVLHERHHIRRGDHVVKLLAFAALALHWFNPLVWLAFSLAGRDMEMSCDEAVMKRTHGAIRADYAQSLLNLSVGHRRFAATPLAFGEGAPKERIKNVLRWKKPAAIGAAVAAVAVAALVVVLAANPKQAERQELAGSRFTVADCVYQSPYLSMYYTPEGAPDYMVTEDLQLLQGADPVVEFAGDGTGEYLGGQTGWNAVGVLHETAYTTDNLYALFSNGISYGALPDEAKRLIEAVTDVWRVNGEAEQEFFLVMQTRNDATLLAKCYGADSGEAQTCVLWRLERSGKAFDPEALQEDVREMNGGDENLLLFSFYEMDDFLLAGFQSGSHMGFATFQKNADGYKLRGSRDFGGASLYSMTIAQEQGMDHSITVALSSRRDLAVVSARAGERHQEQAVTTCPAMAVFEWPEILPEETTVDVRFYNALSEELERTDVDNEQEQTQQELEKLEEVMQAGEEEQMFHAQFPQLDTRSLQSYLDAHPETLTNGWENLYINEAGFDDEGTGIYTIQGDEVLAIDAKNGVLLLRVVGGGYRGVLAIANDPSELSVEMSAGIGAYGELVGDIASAHGGVLAMSASGFLDTDAGGNSAGGNGGLIAGYAISNGTGYGEHFGAGYYRLELRGDNRFYIVDASEPVSASCTDAVEFRPALIVGGEMQQDEYFTSQMPRACIGQTQTGEILMLVIEGRMPDEGIYGADVNTCAAILQRYGCAQALNVDGGTSAMLWFDGEYVTRCSNSNLRESGGRLLPNAFVYQRAG